MYIQIWNGTEKYTSHTDNTYRVTAGSHMAVNVLNSYLLFKN